jgi:hypothetical protein
MVGEMTLANRLRTLGAGGHANAFAWPRSGVVSGWEARVVVQRPSMRQAVPVMRLRRAVRDMRRQGLRRIIATPPRASVGKAVTTAEEASR